MTIAERLKLEGQAEGRMEGEQITRLEIALAMLKKGIEPAIILETTGLTQADLARIRH